jgi:sec-independent protein translocase protein TatB
MFDLGWAEMAIIMLVALIVIGPKDLPKVARTIGQWTGKARALARDFQRSLDDMAREAELDEIKKSIDKAGRFDLKKSVKDMVDPEDEFDRAFDMDDKMKKAKPAPPKSKVGSNVKPKSIAKSDDGEATSRAAAPTSGDAALRKGSGDASASERPAAKVDAGAAADEAASSRG